jgi:hypothetical protein
MQLGPQLFADAPSLPTHTLPGEPQYGGRLFFSADDRHLIVDGAGGRFEVWDLAARRQVFPRGHLGVHAVVPDDRASGLLVAAEAEDGDSIRVVRTSVDGSGTRTLVEGLPRLGPENYARLGVHADTAVVATQRWARWCDLRAGRVTGGFDYRVVNDWGEVSHARPVYWRGALHLRLVCASYRNERRDYTNGVWAADGTEVARLTWLQPGLDRVGGESEGRLEVAADPSGAVVILDGGPDLFRVRPLDGVAVGMLFFLSGDGRAFAGVTEQRVAVWRDGELVRAFDCDGTWCNAWPSEDARVAALVYNPGHLPEPAGVLDLATGQVLGRCDWHVMGFSRSFSRSNRYLASLMTDSQYNYHAGLQSGTIVVSELPPLG